MLSHGYAADLSAHIFGGVPDTPPAQVYVGLWRSWTTNEVTEGDADELTAASHARQAITMGPPDGKGRGTNATAVQWTTDGPWTVLGLAFYDAAVGGRLLAWQPLKSPIVTTGSGDVIDFPVGSITVNLKSRLRGELDWSTIPGIWGYWWGGQFGENCDLRKTDGHDDREVTRVSDQSGQGNDLLGMLRGPEYPGFRQYLQLEDGTPGGFYNTPFSLIGAHELHRGGHFQNVYTFDSPLPLSADFYTVAAFLNTRTPFGIRVAWGATDANDYVELNQIDNSMRLFMGGVQYQVAEAGQVPNGLCICEIFRDPQNQLSLRINGNLISQQSAAGTWNLTGWGHDGSGETSSNQWDDYLCALAVCTDLPTTRHQALMFKELREKWLYGRRDWPRCGWTDYGANLLYRHIFLGEAFPVPAQWHVGLAHMAPGDSISGAAMNEMSEAGYGRAPINFDVDGRARGIRSNDATLDFGTAGDHWTRVPAHWVLTDALGVGAGSAYFWGGLLSSRYVKNGDPVHAFPGDCTVNLSHH